MSKKMPNVDELRAIREFESTDKTRPHLATTWIYEDPEGSTHVATDGHTLVVRRTGTHVAMSPHAVAKLQPRAVLPIDDDGERRLTPPGWATLLQPSNCEGENVITRGINPAYFARVAVVEKASGKRASVDYAPPPGLSRKSAAHYRATLRTGECSEWSIPCAELDPWYWKITSENGVLWEGLIMPRRIR